MKLEAGSTFYVPINYCMCGHKCALLNKVQWLLLKHICSGGQHVRVLPLH